MMENHHLTYRRNFLSDLLRIKYPDPNLVKFEWILDEKCSCHLLIRLNCFFIKEIYSVFFSIIMDETYLMDIRDSQLKLKFTEVIGISEFYSHDSDVHVVANLILDFLKQKGY